MWSDIRNRIIVGHPEWRIVRLRQLVLALKKEQDERDAKPASAVGVTMQDLDGLWNRLRAQRKGKSPEREKWLAERDKLYIAKTGKLYQPDQQGEIAWLLRELVAQFERALLNGDADWLTRQAKAMRWKDTRTPTEKQRAHFNAKVVQLLEHSMWWTQARQGEHSEDLTLTPAGKFTDAMASDIYNALEKQELPNGHLRVESCLFENKGRVMEAIHDMERQLRFELRNWRRKRGRSG